MDVCCKNADGNYSLRAAALIIKDNKLLLVKSHDFDGYYTVGGGIRQNESSDKAVLRECFEETGYHYQIDRLVFVQERFFQLDNTNHHEVVFFYLMKDGGFEIRNGANTDQQKEQLFWVPIGELGGINLVPAFLKTALLNMPEEVTRVVSYE